MSATTRVLPTAPDAAEINRTLLYTTFSVFSDLRTRRTPASTAEVDEVLASAGDGLEVRGWYDVSAFRGDADVMVWWHASQPGLVVWSATGLHRPAEFNQDHVPAFMVGTPPRAHLSVYPFMRSYEWYLLPAEERRTLLAEHGRAAAGYADVLSSTVSSFALGDYEWLLALEADELHRTVDLMRDLRATRARRHVREEVPFYTGTRVPVSELVA